MQGAYIGDRNVKILMFADDEEDVNYMMRKLIKKTGSNWIKYSKHTSDDWNNKENF